MHGLILCKYDGEFNISFGYTCPMHVAATCMYVSTSVSNAYEFYTRYTVSCTYLRIASFK